MNKKMCLILNSSDQKKAMKKSEQLGLSFSFVIRKLIKMWIDGDVKIVIGDK